MVKKTPEKLQFDQMIDDLYPYLPVQYATLARHFRPDIDAWRLRSVVRKRGTEPDMEAYKALLAIKKDTPVERKPRKKYAPRTARQSIAA